jgi:thiamine monophosphate synthase
MALELDFAVLGPVRDKSPALGWQKFRRLACGATVPVYAIGGLTLADMEDAWRAGGHGIAMIRGSWN